MKNTYYQENKEKILERQNLYIKNNKEKVLKQKREWARKHRTELREKGLMPPTKKQLQQRIDKAIEYGKSCINEDLDVDKLDEEYKDIFKIAYEIHKHYLEILGDKE